MANLPIKSGIMRYDDIGTGTPLLLVHGFPLDHAMWGPQVTELREEFRCIVPDLPGFGSSPLGEDPATMEGFAEALRAVLDAAQVEQAVLCGFSMGGYAALAFQQRYPDRLKGLILCSTRAVADDEQGKRNRELTAEKAILHGMGAAAPGMAADLLTPRTRTEWPELFVHVQEIVARQSPAGVAAASRGMAQRPDRTAQLARIAGPTLVIVGDADTLIDPAQGEAMAERIPDCRLVVIPQSGHLANMESPRAFNSAVAAYLRRIG